MTFCFESSSNAAAPNDCPCNHMCGKYPGTMYINVLHQLYQPHARTLQMYSIIHSFSNSRMILTLKISKGYKDEHVEKQSKSRNGCSTAKMIQIHRLDLVFHFECRRWPNQLHEQWPPHFFSYPNALKQIEARHFCSFALTLTSNIPKFDYLLSSRKTCSPDSFGHQPQPQAF